MFPSAVMVGAALNVDILSSGKFVHHRIFAMVFLCGYAEQEIKGMIFYLLAVGGGILPQPSVE